AGASVEYGLPVGALLLQRISAALGPGDSHPWGDNELYTAIANLYPDKLKSYEIAAADLQMYISSGVSSIDDALTWFSSRPEVIDLGKLAIVHEILKAERSSTLFTGNEMTPPVAEFRDNTWMPYVLDMVMDGHRNEDAEQAFGNVTFINFNY